MLHITPVMLTYLLTQHSRANPPELLHLTSNSQQQPQMNTQRSDICPCLAAYPEDTCSVQKQVSEAEGVDSRQEGRVMLEKPSVLGDR